MRSARMRAIASDGPPAANGTTMVMGCAGQGFRCGRFPPNVPTFGQHGQDQASASIVLSLNHPVILCDLS